MRTLNMNNRWLSRLAAIGGAMALAAAPSFAQTTHVVTASGLSFSPADIVIQSGDTVMWTNLMGGFHNVAESNVPASSSSVYNGGFYSGSPGAVDTYSVTFNDVGVLSYICEAHVSFDMFGSITVQSAGGVPTMGEWGLITMSVLLLGFGAFQLKRRGDPTALNS